MYNQYFAISPAIRKSQLLNINIYEIGNIKLNDVVHCPNYLFLGTIKYFV